MVMMIAAAAHLSWCAELSRSTDAHQARLGDGITTGPQTPTPGRIRSTLRAKRAKSPVRKSNMGRLPRPTHNNRIFLQDRIKAGRSSLALLLTCLCECLTWLCGLLVSSVKPFLVTA